MSDWLKIHDLVVETKIGVFDWERNEPQKIWVDLELPVNARQAATHDDVKQTLDYGAFVTAIRNHVQHKSYKLLETMAEEIAGIATGSFGAKQVSVRVKKRSLPGVGEAVVEIRRPLKDVTGNG